MRYFTCMIDVIKISKFYTLIWVLAAILQRTSGQSCQMEGVTFWPVPVSEEIWDWHRGEVTNRATTNIEAINSITYGGGLNRGPYLDVSLSNSRFTMSTNEQYPLYEEYETSDTISLTVNFGCTGGTSNNLIFIVTVTDSNNHSPRFRPTDELEFKVMPPLPPGYLVTGCLNNIIVRDIDLTTMRIDFEIEDNPYLEIAYDPSVTTAVKEFAAVLRTKTFIRTLPEPISLTIYATDVDGTNDPPLTNTTEIRITSDLEFEMPEELVFSQTFYLATYTEDDQVTLQNPISLQQGYDELVTFNLEGEHASYFELRKNGNQLSLAVRTPLPSDILIEWQIFVIVRADRNYTSGSSATIVIEMPEDVSLEFERTHYVGNITDNIIYLTTLILSQGYEGSEISPSVLGEFSSNFNAIVQGNAITITMVPLNESTILENSFIYLEIIASNGRSSARAVATLEIVKDDYVTPMFNQAIYNGNYDPLLGLLVDDILIVQGYDITVRINLQGDYANYFQIIQDGPAIYLRIETPLSTEIYSQGQIVLVIEASKPRTVGANAAIIITLPAARQLEFETSIYRGTLRDDILILGNLTLSSGYDETVTFELTGDHAAYFSVSNYLNQATISLFAPLSNAVIESNNVVILTLTASGINAIPTTTSIILDIIKVDTNTPTFSRNIYYGLYTGSSIQIDNINLTQGYDESVTFRIDGEHSQYFSVRNTGNNVILSTLSQIPEDVIFNEKVLYFNVLAEKQLTVGANAAIFIRFPTELTDTAVMGFTRNTYIGVIEDNALTLEDIVLNVGYANGTEFLLSGEYADYFSISQTENVVSLTLSTIFTLEVLARHKFLVLEIEAKRERAVTVSTTVLIDIVNEDETPLVFSRAYYRGGYTEETGLFFDEQIYLSNGYDETVLFALHGDYASFFELQQIGNSLTLFTVRPLSQSILESHNQLLLIITAERSNAFGRSVITIDLPKEYAEAIVLRFAENSYIGSYNQGQLELPTISLLNNNTDVYFTISGEHASYFNVSKAENVITIDLTSELPMEVINQNTLILLNLEAYYPNSISGHATIVIEIMKDYDIVTPVFDRAYYSGEYSSEAGLSFEYTMQLIQGFDDSVIFALSGDNSQWFELVQSGNFVTLRLASPLPPAVVASNPQLVFVVSAQRTGSATARATIIISLGDEFSGETILGFERINFQGTIENNETKLEPITLIQGYSADVVFDLHGDLESYFILSSVGDTVTLSLRTPIPQHAIPSNRIIVLELQASAPQALTAYATIVLTVVTEENDIETMIDLIFTNTFYTGSYTSVGSLVFENTISLIEGYDESVVFALEGDQSQWFELVQNGNSVTLRLASPLPPAVVASNLQLVFVVSAQRTGSATARATIIISLLDDTQVGADVYFERVLHNGIIQNDIVQHESIRIIGFTESNVDIVGEYASLFVAQVSEEAVSVQRSELDAFPNDVTHVAIELHAGTARTVLVLIVINSDVVNQPLVTFSALSYALRSDITQSGLLGRVVATADNGEAVAYSLVLDNAHLQSRLSINGEGELYLSAPANSGVYTFEVVATTVFTQASGTATVYLTVDALTVCGDDDLVVPPLIIIDRDEEEPHRNLVVLNSTQHLGCWYSLSNRWPVDQTWLYVDETGLHANSIDREHESIAFMALSQIQVELVLHCDSDNNRKRSKRSLEVTWLGPYDYGTNKWVLTDTIQYNSRRSFVNLIVNDINDNAPIFEGKDQEPIAVGYPIPELVDVVIPRALAELRATDADIGENAVLMYWSSEPVLAVAPSTGLVHVRDGAVLEDGWRLTINATDQNGAGLTGSIDILVRLLDTSNIVVMLVRDAFLDNEKNITQELSTHIGYEIKVLRSAVISTDVEREPDNLRMKRDTHPVGASLQLYIYGLISREPVTAERLAADINNIAIATVSIASTVSFEDYLEGREVCVISGRDTGLLVATIILSVLLFIILVLIAVWYFLKWRKEKYDQFTDENSLASRNVSFDQLPKPETLTKPRLNIDDLRRSERRLKEMLDVPIAEVSVVPSTSKNEETYESILDLPIPDPQVPIVIQSIDKLKDPEEDSDEDEFGENRKPRRKSVVTFNENVEKIIHVEDDGDTASQTGYEIYKL